MVSLFMDMSSELVHAILPLYLTTVLGLSVLAVGVIEGVAEATASMLKVVSGLVSDRFERRKPLALLGYGLAALTKPVFPLADTAFGVWWRHGSSTASARAFAAHRAMPSSPT